MQIYVDGKLVIDGMTSTLTNPVLEVGMLHARAMLEFLGLRARHGALVSITPSERRPDDAGIEKIPNGNVYLSIVTPTQAKSADPLDPAGAEASLVGVLDAAGKGMAHLTIEYPSRPLHVQHLGKSAKLIQVLTERHVYDALNRKRPLLPIEARSRA